MFRVFLDVLFSEEITQNTHKIISVLLIPLHMHAVKRKIHTVILFEDLQPVTRDVCRTLQDRQCKYHVTPRYVSATVLTKEQQ
jgi:hypothetical protein